MTSFFEVLLVLFGLAISVFVLDAAIRTFVVPRGTPVSLTYVVFRAVRGGARAVRADRRGPTSNATG